MKLLLDTNIILDIALKREPYYSDSYSILMLKDYHPIEFYLTSSSITDIYYLINKNSNHLKTINFIKYLLQIVKLLTIDLNIVNLALNSNFNDFEDAIQSITADYNNIDFIITRNVKDFLNSKTVAITPYDFLIKHFKT